MTKIFCDICLKEITDKEFACNIMTEEIKSNYNLANGNEPVKQLAKRLIQVCRECFKNNFEQLCQTK